MEVEYIKSIEMTIKPTGKEIGIIKLNKNEKIEILKIDCFISNKLEFEIVLKSLLDIKEKYEW